MSENPLKQLEALGQSIWLDYIKRDMFNGQLEKLIKEDGLRGMTSNPDIFEKAIANSHDYDDAIHQLIKADHNVTHIYDHLTEQDIRSAADLFRPVFDKTHGLDGYVSIEVSPKLAYDTEETIKEGRRLWQEVDRVNIFVKVPGTKEGLPAITQLISEGINVNITLLFGLNRYKQVIDAYLTGIENRIQQQKPIDHISSVASFFLSRIDASIDPMLEKINAKQNEQSSLAKQLQGHIAIASAKQAYVIFNQMIHSKRFKALLNHGIRPQRLLWASTSTKNPNYSDVKYVDEIIAENTVNTLPMQTLNAYRDHGQPEVRIKQGVDQAKWQLEQLSLLGIDLAQVTQQLEHEGVSKFCQAYDNLIMTLKNVVKQRMS